MWNNILFIVAEMLSKGKKHGLNQAAFGEEPNLIVHKNSVVQLHEIFVTKMREK